MSMPKGLGLIFQCKLGSILCSLPQTEALNSCMVCSSFKIIDDFILSISMLLILKGKKPLL